MLTATEVDGLVVDGDESLVMARKVDVLIVDGGECLVLAG